MHEHIEAVQRQLSNALSVPIHILYPSRQEPRGYSRMRAEMIRTVGGEILTTKLTRHLMALLVHPFCDCHDDVEEGDEVRLWADAERPEHYYVVRCTGCGLNRQTPAVPAPGPYG